jgi:hypothetical protein
MTASDVRDRLSRARRRKTPGSTVNSRVSPCRAFGDPGAQAPGLRRNARAACRLSPPAWVDHPIERKAVAGRHMSGANSAHVAPEVQTDEPV